MNTTSPFQDTPASAPKPFKVDPMAKARAVRKANAERRKAEEAATPVAAAPPEASDAPVDDGVAPLPRRARKPFGTPEAKLSWPPRPGYKRRVFNDEPGRIARALEAGYEHVLENGKPICRTVGSAERGGGLTGYLMEIPEEWYDEDFAKKQEALDETDAAIYRGAYKDEEARGDHRYVPSTGIKVNVVRGR